MNRLPTISVTWLEDNSDIHLAFRLSVFVSGELRIYAARAVIYLAMSPLAALKRSVF